MHVENESYNQQLTPSMGGRATTPNSKSWPESILFMFLCILLIFIYFSENDSKLG